jgi:putative tricarboxylic transport membrane protein
MVMGLILGSLVEDNLSRSMIIYDNNWFRFFESPIVDLFFLLTLLTLLWPVISRIKARRAEKG